MFYRPDRTFVEDMKRLDPKLDVRWDEWDERWNVFRVIQKGGGDCPLHVLTVEHQDGSYKPLDNRTIQKLHEMDSWRWHNKYRYASHIDMMDAWITDRENQAKARRLYRLSEISGDMAECTTAYRYAINEKARRH